MKRKWTVLVGAVVLLLAAGGLLWRFFPVSFLEEVEPQEIASIKVADVNNGNQFEVTGRDDISQIVGGIQQATFRKKEIASVPGPWYRLEFIGLNGEAVAELELQNKRAVRKDLSTSHAVFFFSRKK